MSGPPARNGNMPRLLTAADIAAGMGLSVRQVYRLARQADLPAVRTGKRDLRFAEPAVRAWIERGGAPRPKP